MREGVASSRTPIIIRLELKAGALSVDFADLQYIMADTGKSRARSEPVVDGRVMKSTSPSSVQSTHSKEDAPLGRPSSQAGKPKRRNHRGARTYSEVVVETIERDDEGMSNEQIKDLKQLTFFSGHKRVEKTEGILHFYKNNNPRESDIRMVCMLGVSAHLSCQDVLNFCAPAIPSIERIKVIRDSTPNTYMMLILFKSSEDAELFYSDFNDQLFNSLEQDRCTLLFVERIELLDQTVEEDVVELPTCAVCLERMDDGVITIYCRHSFHAECMQKCNDTICPVCRCTQIPEIQTEQRCSQCDQASDLWICLICGNVACGRYREAHAFRHFEETSHTFAQEVGGNRVWDYAGDNYVHRLIQAEQDGKLVAFERQGANVEGDEKIEAVTLEYTCLLTNQLDDQRRYFEKKLNDSERARSNLEKMALAQMDDLEAQLRRAVGECEKLRDEVEKEKGAKASSDKKNNNQSTRLEKLSVELREEQSMNKLLRGDQEKWSAEVARLKAEAAISKTEHQKEMTELRDQLRDIMMHLEGQEKLATQLEKTGVSKKDVEEGIVEVGPPAEDKKKRRKSSKK